MYDTHTVSVLPQCCADWSGFSCASAVKSRLPASGKVLTPERPFLTESKRRVGPMSEATATVLPFPSDRAEAPAVRLALASILATCRPTQLDVARCKVNMRRAVAGLRLLPPREGAPAPMRAVEELERACAACGSCRGI